MPAALFDEWVDFFIIEPWGFDLDDRRFGLQMALIASAGGMKDAKPDKFMIGPSLPSRAAEFEAIHQRQLQEKILARFGFKREDRKKTDT